MERADEFRQICKANHWKCTPQRLAVYNYMHNNTCHPSVDDVWNFARQSISSITRESVYRILNEFSDAGILYRMDKIESAHYDSQTMPHGHLVCEKCGKVKDFCFTELPPLPAGIPQESILHIELRLAWICPACEKSK